MIKPLSRSDSALLVVDVQERLFPHIDRSVELLTALKKVVQGFNILQIPLLLTEQVPEKMGPTLPELKEHLPEAQNKSAFSCLSALPPLEKRDVVLVGVETHVCILQTARDLLNEGYSVTVLRDAVSARTKENHYSALEEMRQFGVRLSSVETVLFELLKDSEDPHFREIRDLVK